MIRRLRLSFIGVTMGMVVLVLAVLMGAINIFNYQSGDRQAAQLIEILSDNGGRFPGMAKRQEDGTVPADPPEDREETSPRGRKEFLRPGMTEETPYETRYFTVLVDEEGQAREADTGMISAVNQEEAGQIAEDLHRGGKKTGYYKHYKYAARQTDQGLLYVFVDCSRTLGSARSFLINSLLVSAGALVVVFLLVVFLSGRAVKPVSESYERQKKFITNAGHEIKTPLAVIESCVDVIELDRGGDKWTEGIRGQVDRLSGLTKNLVALARMDESSATLAMQGTDLSAVAGEAASPFALIAQQQDVQFVPSIEPGVRVKGNPASLQELCTILLDNALKYTAPGGPVRFSLSRRGHHAVITCENPAEGLSPGRQEALFERFYRGDASRNSQTPGYGIGLSMARSIASAHGGRIEAVSPDGKKLVFTVTL